MNDDIGTETADCRPFGIEQAAHQWADMLEQLQPGAESPASCNRGLALGRVHQRQELARQRPEVDAVAGDHRFELLGCCELDLVATPQEAARQSNIGLDVAPRAKRLNGDAHGDSLCKLTGSQLYRLAVGSKGR
jgi:hypothetical protein